MIQTRTVDVYWNLRKKQWSIRRYGRVEQHLQSLRLVNPSFHVQEAGRMRVLKTGQKNVHAYVKGELGSPAVASVFFDKMIKGEPARQIRYNPFRNSRFTMDDRPVGNLSGVVEFRQDGTLWFI